MEENKTDMPLGEEAKGTQTVPSDNSAAPAGAAEPAEEKQDADKKEKKRDKKRDAEIEELKKSLEEQNDKYMRLYAEYDEEFTRTVDSVFGELAENGIRLVDEDKLTDAQKSWVEAFFEDNIVGATSPIWLSKVDDLNLIADSPYHLQISGLPGIDLDLLPDVPDMYGNSIVGSDSLFIPDLLEYLVY